MELCARCFCGKSWAVCFSGVDITCIVQAALVLLLDGLWFGYDQLQFYLNK